MVYAGLYPIDGADFPELREALDKLQLNDAALVYEPETSGALGFGFRIGFLGLLHMEIVRERLEREFNLDLISTAPNVVYRVVMEDGTEHIVTNPSRVPGGQDRRGVRAGRPGDDPHPDRLHRHRSWSCARPAAASRPGMDYLSRGPGRDPLHAAAGRDRLRLLRRAEVAHEGLRLPRLRRRPASRRPSWSRSTSCCTASRWTRSARSCTPTPPTPTGVAMAKKLKELIPRQQFEVPIQAAIGARVIARETIRAIRKDVLAKCYGGDITRKRKLLEKQKEGKKRMKMVGRVEVPQEAFVAALSTGETTEKKK